MGSVLARYSSSCKVRLTINIYTYLHTIYILYLHLQVKVTVQRAAVPPLSLVEEDEQMVTPPSVIKIVTGQGPSPADVQVNRGKISV